MHPKEISIHQYTYELPDNKIARYPLEKRDQSKLLVYENGKIATTIYAELAEFIPPESLLVFNNTKVVEARLHFQKETGGSIEIFCLEPAAEYPDITTAMLQKEKVRWKCLVGGAKKWKSGSLKHLFTLGINEFLLVAEKIAKEDDYYIIELSWNNPDISFAEVLHQVGKIPLPPYLNRPSEIEDKERYQTIYAAQNGSVAAPTAGLHFTETIFRKLQQRNIKKMFLTLHVGAGTFQPVKSEKMANHPMHVEFIEVEKLFIERLIDQIELKLPVIAVGTTSLRTIESLYWLGLKTFLNPNIDVTDLLVSQWDAYELDNKQSTTSAMLRSLLQWMKKNHQENLLTKTQIIIAPGYPFKVIDGLITNFHQPQSTLLLLVAAITGEDWHKIYHYALTHDFRFLSYGDGSLLWRR